MLNLKNLPYTIKKRSNQRRIGFHMEIFEKRERFGLMIMYPNSQMLIFHDHLRFTIQYQMDVVPVIDPSGAAVLPLWQGSLAPFIAPKSLPYSRVLQAPQEQKLVVEPPI